MEEKQFPFVNVPPEALSIVGQPTPGTRFYRREGSDEECGDWFEGIGRIFQGDVGLSPGGVVMFVPVSRAAVHKRLREGRLTGFAFYVTSHGKSLWGKPRKIKESPYLVVPVSECKAWAAELKRKAGVAEKVELKRDQLREVLRPVTDSDEPDTDQEMLEHDQFVQRDPKDKGLKDVVYGEPMTQDEMRAFIGTQVILAVEQVLAAVLPGNLREEHRKRLERGSLVYDEVLNLSLIHI